VYIFLFPLGGGKEKWEEGRKNWEEGRKKWK